MSKDEVVGRVLIAGVSLVLALTVAYTVAAAFLNSGIA
jgi:hypothetical protein